MRTHVRRRSEGSRRALDEGRHAASDLLVLLGQALRRPAHRTSDHQAGHELIGVARKAAAGAAAAVAAALVARAEAGLVAIEAHRRSIEVGRADSCMRHIRDRGPVLVKRSFPKMDMHVRLGCPMMAYDARRFSTRHAGGENRQADREHRDEYRPQLVQRWAASVRVCNEMSSRRTVSSKVHRGLLSETRQFVPT